MDWTDIKTAYIQGGTSYRELARRFGVSFSTLQKIAAKEGWKKLRDKVATKSDEKLVRSLSAGKAKTGCRVNEVADMLLDKLRQAVAMTDTIDPQTIRQYTGALKDLRDIKNIRSEADIREQEARIANLQKQAAREDSDREIVVRLDGDTEAWSR